MGAQVVIDRAANRHVVVQFSWIGQSIPVVQWTRAAMAWIEVDCRWRHRARPVCRGRHGV